MQNWTFDPGGSQGRLRTCPFWGSWRALLCMEVHVRAGLDCSVFWRIDDSGLESLQESGTGEITPYV